MINDILDYILKYIGTLELTFNWSDFIQIAFLAGLLLFLYKKFIKNTSSEKFVKGILILVCFWVLSEILLRIKASLANLEINGPNTFLAVTPDKELLCVCDSKKLRPVVIGKDNDTVIMTSEVAGINDLMPDRDITKDIYPNEHETVVVKDDLTIEIWQQ